MRSSGDNRTWSMLKRHRHSTTSTTNAFSNQCNSSLSLTHLMMTRVHLLWPLLLNWLLTYERSIGRSVDRFSHGQTHGAQLLKNGSWGHRLTVQLLVGNWETRHNIVASILCRALMIRQRGQPTEVHSSSSSAFQRQSIQLHLLCMRNPIWIRKLHVFVQSLGLKTL